MYDLTKEVMETYASESREIGVRATFNNNVVLTGENIKSYKITDSVGGTDSLSLGNACSKRLEMSILVPPELTSIEAAKVEVEIGVDVNGTVEYTPLGLFYVNEVETSDNYKTVNITAYDLMYKIESVLGEKYVCKCTQSEVMALDVIEDICSQAGVAFNRRKSKGYDSSEYANVQWVDNFDIGTGENSLSASCSPTELSPKVLSIAITVENNVELTEADLAKLSAKVVVKYIDSDDDVFTPELKLTDYDGNGKPVASKTHIGTNQLDISGNWNAVTSVTVYIYGFSEVTGSLIRGFRILYYSYIDHLGAINTSMYMSTGALGNYAPRDMLGYMAGVLGCNAVTDRQGNVTLKAVELTDIRIPLEQQFMNGVSKAVAKELFIDYITTGSSSEDNDGSNIITIGNGAFGFNFENPFLSPSSPLDARTAVQNIYNKYQGLGVLPCTVSYRGNPAIDCGDIVQLENADGTYSNVFVLNQTLSVTGGFSEEIDSAIKTDVSKDFVSVPPSKKLSYKLDDFVQTYTEIIKALTGAQGGYVKWVLDSNNKIRAIAITESDIELKWDDTNNKVVTVKSADRYSRMWVWSYGGLGYTANGGGSYNVAINMNGQIYANLVAGKLSKAVELQAEKGVIGGWTIEAQDLYKDFTDGTTTYRAYIQGAKGAGVSDIGDSWVFSTQNVTSSTGGSGNFVVTAKGNVTAKEIQCDKIYTHDYGNMGKGLKSQILLVGKDAEWYSGYSLCHKGTADMGQVIVNGNLKAETSLYLNYLNGSYAGTLLLDTNARVYTSGSSKRWKTNITSNLSNDLIPENLYELPIVQFEFDENHKELSLIDGTQIGLIAEDVDKFYPNACLYDKDGNPVNWSERIMIPAMLKLIQDQKEQINALEKRVADLENKQEVI